MATSNATLKCKWTTGIIYAAVIAVISAVVIWFGLNYAMPVTLTGCGQFYGYLLLFFSTGNAGKRHFPCLFLSADVLQVHRAGGKVSV